MRDLKFRFWNKKEKRYVVGTGILNLNMILGTLDITSDKYIAEQYTGFSDQNGKDVYEGDLIKWALNIIGEKKILKVVFDITDGAWKLSTIDEEFIAFLSEECPSEGREWFFEVIGNIHENPELLGVKNNE